MSDYAVKWKTAKVKYETDTLRKKPSETVKILTKKIRVKSGVAAKLKEVDKLFPVDMRDALDDKDIGKVRKATIEARKAGLAYIAAIEKDIAKEKAAIGGKDASVLYRDLKILRASLDAIMEAIKSDLAKMEAARVAARRDVDGALKATFITLRTLREGIDRNGKAALLTCQKLLKDPTPDNFNAVFPKAARDLTQQFAQIKKWTLPDTIGDPVTRQNRLDQLQDPKLARAVDELNAKVAHFKTEVLPYLAENGNTAANASLGKMAAHPIRVADDATPQDVKAAVKNFAQQVKEAITIGRKMI